ncbi:MAG: hypothetical protein LAT75_12205 [Candidatus Cyclonatronum sp.]|uniref:PID-CTERM protein-sorting domain-containing protein n=1 Tax=Cyclonatronum sp. TaxID=3024185 RepID=UPI0025BDBB11|nr:hypothetical protein [Cyclonatronum sp.]MCH8487622.1 hypothetical protein [Cyclonatronum sp.]
MNRLFSSFAGLIVLALLFVLPLETQAQDRDQQVWRDNPPAQPLNNPGPPQLPGAPTQTPIGSGLGILLAAGGAYALRKLKQQKNDGPAADQQL